MDIIKSKKFTIVTDREGWMLAEHIAEDLKRKGREISSFVDKTHAAVTFYPDADYDTVELAVKAMFKDGYKISFSSDLDLAIAMKA